MGTQKEEQRVCLECVDLIEHVVVVVFSAVVGLDEVLHLLLGPARPVAGRCAHRTHRAHRAHRTQAVAVVVLVI